ncbi:hypothetical protein NOR51B_1743 [Luminiphilus syltensis NOR5-1B]|uniref:Uncharacterized protein n=2 Tax=Luminiphilus TaxID=1341118 RepID=B8KTE2_9GAMM|nr:hypothetical protein NOR51B_1743 [Luminiphilus syltensis NOR5-1B]
MTMLCIASFAATSSTAQTDGAALIARCAQIDDSEGRIACLETAVMALSGTSAPIEASQIAAPPKPASNQEAKPLSDPSVTAVAAGKIASEDSSDTAIAEIADSRLQDEQAEAAEDAIGAEQVEASTRTRAEHLASLKEARNLSVKKFETVGYKQLQVYLENGQVWRQIRGDVQNIRASLDRNPTVDIIESSIGGYRLQLNEMKRTIRVRRVR